jgi:hypothetical protein
MTQTVTDPAPPRCARCGHPKHWHTDGNYGFCAKCDPLTVYYEKGFHFDHEFVPPAEQEGT